MIREVRERRGNGQATRLRRVGAAHSRHSVTDITSASGLFTARSTRTTALARQDPWCQHERREQRHAPDAGVRSDVIAEAGLVDSGTISMPEIYIR